MTTIPRKRAAVDPCPPDPVREPGSAPPVAEPGIPSSPQPSERQAAGGPVPGTGEADPAAGNRLPASPGRGTDISPAGASLKAHGSRPAGSTGRTFTIALPAGMKLLSLNDRLHFGERYRRSEALKEAAWAVAKQAKVPRLERASIAVEYQPPDRRHRDADNPVASAKACVDGIVKAGVLEDDECPRYVVGIWCTIGELYPLGRLVLHLTELPPLVAAEGAA